MYHPRETICMIGIHEEIQEDKGDMNDGCDITVEDVERLRKILTPSIHNLPNLKPIVQPYMPLGLVCNKKKVKREEEQDYDIPLQDHFGEEFDDNTRVSKKIDSNLVNDLKELLKTYDFETFIQKLLQQLSQSSNKTGSIYKELEFEVSSTRFHVVAKFFGYAGNVGSQRKFALHGALRALIDMLLVAMLIKDVSLASHTDEEFKVSEPSDTRITPSHSSTSLNSTIPLSLDHPLTQASPTPTPTRVLFHRRTACMAVRTQPTLSPSTSARIAEAVALSPSSLHSDAERKGSEDEGPGLDDKGHSLEDEGPCLEEEEEEERGLPEQDGEKRISTFREPTLVTWVDPKDGKVYTDILTYVPPAVPVQTPPSLEWLSGSLLVSPSSLVVPSPISSLVTTLAATISVDEDQFLEVGAQLELYKSILLYHTQRLDALPPTLFEGYDRDLRELYTRSGAVRDEIFSQRENHDLRRQIADERRERLELTYRVARIERGRESRGE
ncbi:hypothetical protein Tco_0476404 [Tanacetum coccineum]